MYFVNIIFETHKVNGELKKDSESHDLNFFDIANLPVNVTKPFECVRHDLLKKINNNMLFH